MLLPMTPARLAAPDNFPNCLIVSEIQSWIWAGLRTSTEVVRTFAAGAIFFIDAAADSSSSCCMSARLRVAPRTARYCAVASPIPEAAPVIAMTLPSKGVGIVEKVD